jgi:hypothetical protein
MPELLGLLHGASAATGVPTYEEVAIQLSAVVLLAAFAPVEALRQE